MGKFPKTLPLPESVHETRNARRHAMVLTARRGIFARCAIILAEMLGFAYWNSSSLLADALSTLVDVASSLCLIFFIRLADRPPDRNHPFGHGRFEPIAGLQLGLVLAGIGVWMLIHQAVALFQKPSASVIDPRTWTIAFGAVVLLEICYQYVRRTAVRENSPALMAEAVHYRIDGINSLFALSALVMAAVLPESSQLIDHFGALAIAAIMVGVGCFAAKNNIHQLMDHKPEGKYFDLVREAAMQVEGVLGTEKLKIQVYGPDAHVNIDVEVLPELSVELAHEITQKVRNAIQCSWPAVRDVAVHVEPYYANDH